MTANENLKEQAEEMRVDMGAENLKIILVKDLVHVKGADCVFVDEAVWCIKESELVYNEQGDLDGFWNKEKAKKWYFVGGNFQPNFLSFM